MGAHIAAIERGFDPNLAGTLLIISSYAVIAIAERFFPWQESWLHSQGDVLTDIDLTKIVDYHREKGSMATIGLIRVDNPYLAVATVSYLLVLYVSRSPFGLALQGVRDNARRMEALGFNVTAHRIGAYAFAAVIAAMPAAKSASGRAARNESARMASLST